MSLVQDKEFNTPVVSISKDVAFKMSSGNSLKVAETPVASASALTEANA